MYVVRSLYCGFHGKEGWGQVSRFRMAGLNNFSRLLGPERILSCLLLGSGVTRVGRSWSRIWEPSKGGGLIGELFTLSRNELILGGVTFLGSASPQVSKHPNTENEVIGYIILRKHYPTSRFSRIFRDEYWILSKTFQHLSRWSYDFLLRSASITNSIKVFSNTDQILDFLAYVLVLGC